LRECFEQDEKKEALRYIDTALENVGKSYRRINTGHLAIDALVSNAYNNAHLCNIDFKSDIRIEAGKINIERYDLSVALGNLLDNALEACQKMPVSNDRYISVMIATSEVALVINIVNSKERGGFEPTTSKSDQLRHGYGLGNVAAIAEKYGGTFTVASEEARFEATAILPMKDVGDRSGL
jgi:sensor histidine kinase regulating citrate/malate metabolism